MITVEQFRKASLVEGRRTGLRALAFLALGYALAFGLMKALQQNLSIESSAGWLVRNALDPGILGFAVLILAVLPAIPVAALMWLTGRNHQRDARLDCPHCHRALLGVATITGNCQRCGQPALSLPPEPSETQVRPLWTVAEFNSAARNRLRGKDPKLSDPRLKCPKCRTQVMGRRFFVVTTRKCLKCRASLLLDPEEAANDDSRVERFYLPFARFRWAHRWYGRCALLSVFLIMALALVPPGLVAANEEPLKASVGEPIVIVMALGGFLGGMCLGGVACWLAGRFLQRIWRLNCPHCGQCLHHDSGIVIATRRCHQCGRRVLEHETDAVIGNKCLLS
jgi:hypothetical protein